MLRENARPSQFCFRKTCCLPLWGSLCGGEMLGCLLSNVLFPRLGHNRLGSWSNAAQRRFLRSPAFPRDLTVAKPSVGQAGTQHLLGRSWSIPCLAGRQTPGFREVFVVRSRRRSGLTFQCQRTPVRSSTSARPSPRRDAEAAGCLGPRWPGVRCGGRAGFGGDWAKGPFPGPGAGRRVRSVPEAPTRPPLSPRSQL